MTADVITLSDREQNAIVTLCILAAFADGAQSEVERAEIRRIADKFSSPDLNLSGVYQDALSGRLSVRDASSQLDSQNARALAYEMAVCICNVDGAETPSEKQFLKTLRDALNLPESETATFTERASALRPETAAMPPVIADVAGQEIDQMILNRSILAGALELMPQRLATMAIVPVQIQTVYAVGKKHGYDLSWSHAKEFLATVGVGMASQMVEGYLTKYVTKLAKPFVGKMAGGLINQATQSALAFATTYAIGQAAQSYYASGRTLTTPQLRNVFSTMLTQGQSLKPQFASDILNRSRSMSVTDLLPLIRKG